MLITKECRCCGMLLEYPEGLVVYPCPSCGTANERPKVQGQALISFRNAIRLQLDNEFDRAQASYDLVFNADPDNAEALWGRLLCHYGAEFVEDGSRRRYNIHRPDPAPLRDQPDFRRACALAAPAVRAQWEQDAAYIDQANQSILRLARTKPAYDIFLCQKTTLPGGGYTEDYNRAYGLYNLLTKEGYRVFFAPAEMPGTASGETYEAAIYHALDTARVMLVVCSKPENLESRWVRSEWQRYLRMIDSGREKNLIPLLYGGMKAHELPDAFRYRSLQAITMELGGEKALLESLALRLKRPQSSGKTTKTKKAGKAGKTITAVIAGALLIALAAGVMQLPQGGELPWQSAEGTGMRDGAADTGRQSVTAEDELEQPPGYQPPTAPIPAPQTGRMMLISIVPQSGRARENAGTEYEVAAYVYGGERYEVYEKKKGTNGRTWYRIRVDGVDCWVSEGITETLTD